MQSSSCRWIGLFLVVVASCGGSRGASGTGDDAEGSGGTATTNGHGTTSGLPTTGSEGGVSDSGCGPECSADMGPPGSCDLFAQDCKVGEKCAPWAPDGAGLFAAAHCVPAGDGQPGEPCVAMNSDEGLDDCARGSKCWDLDAEQRGLCVGLCVGSAEAPVCAVDGGGFQVCTVDAEDALALCRRPCDPFQEPCVEGQLCLPTEDNQFLCFGVHGPLHQQDEACESLAQCDASWICVAASAAPPACGGVDCCEPYCKYPDGECPYPEQTCMAIFGPDGGVHMDVGYCVVVPPGP